MEASSKRTTRRDVIQIAALTAGSAALPSVAWSQTPAQEEALPAHTEASAASAESNLRQIAASHFSDPRLRENFVLRCLAALNTVRENRNQLDFPVNSIEQFSKCLARTGTAPDPTLPDPALHAKLRGVLKAAYTAAPSLQPGDFQEIEDNYKTGIESNSPEFRKHLRWTDPLGGLSHDLQGIDASVGFIAPAPTFSGATTAGEMVECYWLALLRDTSLLALSEATIGKASAEDQERARAAVASLKDTAAFSGIDLDHAFRLTLRREDGSRFGFKGVDKGPYLSQFLAWEKREGGPINLGSLRLDLRQQSVKRGIDYLYDPDARDATSYFAVHNGSGKAIGVNPPSETLRFIDTVRDGANYAHFDKIYQEYLIAACIMLADLPALGATLKATAWAAARSLPADMDGQLSSMTEKEREAALHLIAEQGVTREDLLNFGNPYFNSDSQVGFATFGVTHAVTVLSEVATRAHKAAWYQKWLQARLRPEEFGARLHFGDPRAKFHSDVTQFNWKAARTRWRPDLTFPDSRLMPMAYPEGCPTHPAYPSGHATVAGACVTALKAIFDETRPFVGPDVDVPVRVVVKHGTSIEPLPDLGLTVGGELNKLASNISYFRTMSGVHWASDGVQGVLLGEQVTISILVQQSQISSRSSMFREFRKGFPARPAFRFSMFSGQRIEIRDGQIYLFPSVAEGSTDAEASQAEWSGLSSNPISVEQLLNDYQSLPTYD